MTPLFQVSREIFLKNACDVFPGIRAYEQLGYRAFGTPGKMAAGIAITLQNIGGKGRECMVKNHPLCLHLYKHLT